MRQARAQGRGPAARARSERPDLGGLRALGTLVNGVLHLLVFSQRAVTARFDRRVVNENIRGAVVGGDETKPLVRVEPFHGSLSHLLSPSRNEPCDPRGLRGSAGVARRSN